MQLRRLPGSRLRPFVETLWVSDAPALGPREIVVPTGAMHLVFRLSDTPLVLYDHADDTAGRDLGCAIVGGARTSAYVRDVSRPTRSVGAQLRPGVAELLFGVPAEALAERHTRLDDLWGPAAREARDRIRDAHSPADQLDAFERVLSARLPLAGALHPVVAHGLARLAVGDEVTTVVGTTGYSHRVFVEMFRRAVGVAPKRWSRVQRLSRVLAAPPTEPWAAVAQTAGYSDQAHLAREFRALTGVTPSEYRAAAPAQSHHVVVKNLQDAQTGPKHRAHG